MLGNNSRTLKFNYISSIIASKRSITTLEAMLALRNAERFLDDVVAASIAETCKYEKIIGLQLVGTVRWNENMSNPRTVQDQKNCFILLCRKVVQKLNFLFLFTQFRCPGTIDFYFNPVARTSTSSVKRLVISKSGNISPHKVIQGIALSIINIIYGCELGQSQLPD
ncbi:MAG: hypothetical protein EZS28_031682 [Streblomastix strix]|uniref:Uncharacterized protein n=1 Tax=Streblomastix strix TaxID=222440 RepID=A0A5J4US55_9EUKA|nr:MAG: hypothetical protein EZS28_031682 [Streblomastix strix]